MTQRDTADRRLVALEGRDVLSGPRVPDAERTVLASGDRDAVVLGHADCVHGSGMPVERVRAAAAPDVPNADDAVLSGRDGGEARRVHRDCAHTTWMAFKYLIAAPFPNVPDAERPVEAGRDGEVPVFAERYVADRVGMPFEGPEAGAGARVPEFDRAVLRTRHNDLEIGCYMDGGNRIGVSFECADANARGAVPHADCIVLASGDNKFSVTAAHDGGNCILVRLVGQFHAARGLHIKFCRAQGVVNVAAFRHGLRKFAEKARGLAEFALFHVYLSEEPHRHALARMELRNIVQTRQQHIVREAARTPAEQAPVVCCLGVLRIRLQRRGPGLLGVRHAPQVEQGQGAVVQAIGEGLGGPRLDARIGFSCYGLVRLRGVTRDFVHRLGPLLGVEIEASFHDFGQRRGYGQHAGIVNRLFEKL